MKLLVSCKLHFQVDQATVLILMLRPFKGLQQWVSRELYSLNPVTPMLESTDGFGNSSQRLVAPLGNLVIQNQAEVTVLDQADTAPGAFFVEIQYLPLDVLVYLLPSRYCESDRFGDMATEITADASPGYDQVVKINQWVRDSINYEPGSSQFPISAVEVHNRGYGVCRDLAQVGIALCRSISIPARLVVGYLHKLQPMDLHAWFEVYVGNRWYAFDPTQHDLDAGRVIIAFGRDAADVAVFHQFGSGCRLIGMDVNVDLLDNPPIVY